MPEKEFTICSDQYLFTLSPIYGKMKKSDQSLSFYRRHDSNNYLGKSLNQIKLNQSLRRQETCQQILKDHLKRMGYDVNVKIWQGRNWDYLWLKRLSLAIEDITKIVPAGEKFIIVNEDKWGDQVVPERVAVPFPECNGIYWGYPKNDKEAITEVIRQKSNGFRFLFFWWVSFSWLETYPKFKYYLESNHICILENDRLLAFDLKGE